MKRTQTKQQLLESIERGLSILKTPALKRMYDKVKQTNLPDLEGDWEYNLKDDEIIKYELFHNGRWWDKGEEVICG